LLQISPKFGLDGLELANHVVEALQVNISGCLVNAGEDVMNLLGVVDDTQTGGIDLGARGGLGGVGGGGPVVS
jgi:hypothetical protein